MTEPARLTLSVLPQSLAICRLPPGDVLPGWIDWAAPFLSVTRTAEEISVVCRAESVPAGIRCEPDWRALKVEGPLDLSMTGVLAGLAAPLADAGIALFAVSSFDTDYLLVRGPRLAEACAVLAERHRVQGLPHAAGETGNENRREDEGGER